LEDAVTAKIAPRERRTTALVAALVFALFVFATLQFHDAAAIASKELGLSAWTDSPATASRFKALIDDIVHTNAVAGWLANRMDASRLESTESPTQRQKVWEFAKNVAEGLADDAPKARLVSRWALEMRKPERLSLAQPAVQELFRNARSSDNAPSTVKTLDTLVQVYQAALVAAAGPWVADELPSGAVVGILRASDIDIKQRAASTSPAPKRKGAAHAQPTAKEDVTPLVVADFHGSIVKFFETDHVKAQIRVASRQDLTVNSAQPSLVRAIERDYAGRWMWAIAAAIFATAAAAAVLGGIWRTYNLVGPGKRLWPVVAYLVALIVGIGAGLFNVRPMPPFLTDPLTQFNTFYQLGIQTSASVLKGLTVAAVCALIVASWCSFLFRTTSDDHLEQQLATLRWSFHAATFVLVAGVLHVYAFYQWPSSFMSEDAAAAIQSGAKVFALALGAVFSTLLLLMYVPGAKVLVREARARQAAADQAGSTRIEDMLRENGFDTAPVQQVVRFAQLFAPLLIAPIGAEIVGLLGP